MARAARSLTRPRRRRLAPDARRLELIEAAERVLRERGDGDSRVEDVVRAAGVAKGTFYLYFATWDDLLAALRARIYETVDARMAALPATTGGGDWWAMTDALAVGFVDFVLDLGGLHGAVFHGPFADRNPPGANADATARIATFLRAGMAAGAFRDLDPEPAGRLIFALLHETADAIARGADRTRALATLTLLLHRCLGDAAPPGRRGSTHAARR